MIRPIIIYDDPILRNTSKDIDLQKSDIKEIISDMWETMYDAKGAGLAASQIGLNLNLIVVDEEISPGEIFKNVFINAKILNYAGYLSIMKEGCLSFPGLCIDVLRPLTIEVEWYDEKFIYHKEFFTGITARILQHEIDHTNGLLFIDRLHPDEKLKIFKELEGIKNKREVKIE